MHFWFCGHKYLCCVWDTFIFGTSEQILGTLQLLRPNGLGFQVLKLIVINLKVGFFFHILAWAFFTRTTSFEGNSKLTGFIGIFCDKFKNRFSQKVRKKLVTKSFHMKLPWLNFQKSWTISMKFCEIL